MVARPEVDIVVAGDRRQPPACEARGPRWKPARRVALANKETLVMAGPLVMQLAADTRRRRSCRSTANTAPCFNACRPAGATEVQTHRPHRQRRAVSQSYRSSNWPASPSNEALAHPTWDMGPKITIDSATMMNKALEIIEARWLFDLRPEQIDVVIHPQSVVHSLVEFVDGSVIAQLSPPDMKLPIQYALYYPQRRAGISPTVGFSRVRSGWISSRPIPSGFRPCNWGSKRPGQAAQPARC